MGQAQLGLVRFQTALIYSALPCHAEGERKSVLKSNLRSIQLWMHLTLLKVSNAPGN